MAKKLIHIDPDILSGEPVIYGTRVPVKTLFDWLESESMDDFLENYPTVTREQAIGVLKLAEKFIQENQSMHETVTG